jgi:hypothetical protein
VTKFVLFYDQEAMYNQQYRDRNSKYPIARQSALVALGTALEAAWEGRGVENYKSVVYHDGLCTSHRETLDL